MAKLISKKRKNYAFTKKKKFGRINSWSLKLNPSRVASEEQYVQWATD